MSFTSKRSLSGHCTLECRLAGFTNQARPTAIQSEPEKRVRSYRSGSEQSKVVFDNEGAKSKGIAIDTGKPG
jgi:hypothetical protein